MQPENFRFGGGVSGTILHPLVAVWILVAVVLILTLRRDKAIIPFMLAFFMTPAAQILVVAGIHFTMRQILILAVLARMVAFSGEKFAGGFNALDRIVVLWALSSLIIFNIEWMQMQALIKSLGDLIESLGGYLAARFLIPDRETLRRTVKLFALVCLIQGVCMMSELVTSRNVFGFAGGATPSVREGHVRAEGAMGTLYAGAIAGALTPLFVWLWTERKSRMAAAAGLLGAASMIFASHASTSWMACGAGLVALAFWPLRKMMRLVRCGIVAMLVGLHLVMHGPVWSLIEKIDLTGGSSSYHRYELVDNCIRHFSEWWLIGYKDYYSWGFCMFDLCDQWVVAAVTGGLVTLVLYIMIYSRGFGAIGAARRRVEGDKREEWFFWCLGVFLFGNIAVSFGINYMFHLLMCFFLGLACISVAAYRTNPAEIPAAEPLLEHPFALAPGNSG